MVSVTAMAKREQGTLPLFNRHYERSHPVDGCQSYLYNVTKNVLKYCH